MTRFFIRLFLFTILLFAIFPANATTGQRTALVIGNGAYKSSPLRNPVNDAHDMAALLKKLGFDVIQLTDATRREMETAINKLGRKLRQGGTGLFYFAGHGVQVAGINYLIPIGANIETEGDVKFESVNANRILSKMQDAGNPLNMVFLDACRNNPFARMFRSTQQGLAPMDAPKGSLVAFATAPGDTAADGTGRNGVFTKHLIKYMPQPGLEVGPMMRRVRSGVQADTGDKQTPFEVSSLTGNFYFNTGSGGLPAAGGLPPSVDLPPLPPGPTASGIGDYEAIARKRKAAMAQWESWQNSMESEFGEAEALCNDPVFKPGEKIDIWGRFLSAYGDDNPYSDRDEALRVRAEAAQKEWKSRKGQMPAMGVRPGTAGGTSLTNSPNMKFANSEPRTMGPDVIKMDNPGYQRHKKGIVMFAHKKHVDAYKIGCGECHHDDVGKPLGSKMGDKVQSCGVCHKTFRRIVQNDKKLSISQKIAKYHEVAMHANCIGCHKSYNQKNKTKAAPMTCKGCHPKK